MSVKSEIQRISNNVSESLTALEEKGIPVSATDSSNTLSTLIRRIPIYSNEDGTITIGTVVFTEAEITVLKRLVSSATVIEDASLT